jgi:transglutaminase-like putative cysteine protease
MIFDVSHQTTYKYSQPVSISHHMFHLSPRTTSRQICHRSALTVDPAPALNESGTDFFGNPITFVALQTQHKELLIHSRSVVEVSAPSTPAPASTLAWDQVYETVERDRSPLGLQVLQFAFDSPFTAADGEVARFARESFPAGRPILEAALDLTSRIYNEFKYEGGATTVTTTVDEVLRMKRGVCQDFAHLQIACFRAMKLPARYVSGYLLTKAPEGREKLIGADASHAWLSVWCPGYGWVDLDPTNNLIPTDEHVLLAWGRDYGDVSPVNGVIFGGGEHVIDVSVDVRSLPDTGIVTMR